MSTYLVTVIAATAAGMVEAGQLDPENIDWSALRDEHMRRLEALSNDPAVNEYVMRRIWERAREAVA